MVNISLVLALVFTGLTIFMAIRTKEWWLAAFAIVAGLLLAGNKAGIWATTQLNDFANWLINLFH